jgi:hypothetical protein
MQPVELSVELPVELSVELSIELFISRHCTLHWGEGVWWSHEAATLTPVRTLPGAMVSVGNHTP